MSRRRASAGPTALGILLAVMLAASAVAVGAAAPGYEVYSVQAGDTLDSVAGRFGVSAAVVAEANRLARDAQLRPGQSLTIPTAGSADANAAAQDRFAAEERAAQDIEAPQLTIQPAAKARSGPVVGYLGVATQDTHAVIDPRTGQRVCAIARGAHLCVSCEYGNHYGVLMTDGALAWVPKSHVLLQPVELVAGVEVAVGAAGRAEVVQAAFRYYGLPYYYGGAPPGPTDCSALVQAAFRDRGMHLPRTAAAQFSVGYAVPLEQLAVGDRVYFYSSDGRIGHAGIYIGNGQFIHASSRRGYVGIDTLRSGFYHRRLAGARRP